MGWDVFCKRVHRGFARPTRLTHSSHPWKASTLSFTTTTHSQRTLSSSPCQNRCLYRRSKSLLLRDFRHWSSCIHRRNFSSNGFSFFRSHLNNHHYRRQSPSHLSQMSRSLPTLCHRRWFAAPRPDPAKDYYKILEVSPTDDNKKVKKQYIKLVKKWHPDVHAKKGEAERKQAQEKFQDIYEAYEVLTDAAARKEYDDLRKRGVREKPPPQAQNPGFDRQAYQRYSGFDFNRASSSSGTGYRRSRSAESDFDREFRQRMKEEFERISREQHQWGYERENEYQYDNGYSRRPYPVINPFRTLFRFFVLFFVVSTLFRVIGQALFGTRYDRYGYPIQDNPWDRDGGPNEGLNQQTRYRSPWNGDTSAASRWDSHHRQRPAYDPRDQALRRNREDAEEQGGLFGRPPPGSYYPPPPPPPRRGAGSEDRFGAWQSPNSFRYTKDSSSSSSSSSDGRKDSPVQRRRPPPPPSFSPPQPPAPGSGSSRDYSGRSSISGAKIDRDFLPESQSPRDQHPSSEARRLEYLSRHGDIESKAEFVRKLKAKAERERLEREQTVARRDFRLRESQRRSRAEWDEGVSDPSSERRRRESPNEAWKRMMNSHDSDRDSKNGWRD